MVMTKELAAVALEFMRRTQLQGGEVQAWQAVVAALTAIANGAADAPAPGPRPLPAAPAEHPAPHEVPAPAAPAQEPGPHPDF